MAIIARRLTEKCKVKSVGKIGPLYTIPGIQYRVYGTEKLSQPSPLAAISRMTLSS